MAFGLTPWDPFRDFDRFERLIRRPFETGFMRGGMEAIASPAVEVTDEGDHYLVKCEIPGVDEKDVEITLSGNVLTIRGEKRYEKRTGGGGKTIEAKAEKKGQGQEQQAPAQQQQAGKQSGQMQQAGSQAMAGRGGAELSRPLYTEVFYGSFERTLTLPDDIDADKVEATTNNGIFSISVGKKEQQRARKINVTRH